MVIRVPLYLISHEQKIASVYKKYLRFIQGNEIDIIKFRFKAVVARCEFDAIVNEKDMRIAKEKLLEKEAEFNKFTYNGIIYPDSPDGVAYNVEPPFADYVLDHWHPLEKAIYPIYFAKREARKQQYIEMWDRNHGPPPPEGCH